MNLKLRRVTLAIVLLTFCWAGTRQQCLAQYSNYEDWIKELYAFESWVGRTKVPYQQIVTNWAPDFGSLGVTNFLLRREGVWTNSQRFGDYIFQPADAPAAQVRLRVWELQDATNAHWAMLQYFETCAAPQPFPLGSSLGVDIGDRSYLSWGPVGGWVVFVRNNVFVSISASAYSVLSLAERLDCELVVRSFTGPVLLAARISDRAFQVSVPTAVSKTYVLESMDALSGTNWSAWPPFSGDGTIRLMAYPTWSPQRFFRLRVE